MGFDINCGVRLIRTNLTEKDVAPVKEELTQSLFDHIPVGESWDHVTPMIMMPKAVYVALSVNICAPSIQALAPRV